MKFRDYIKKQIIETIKEHKMEVVTNEAIRTILPSLRAALVRQLLKELWISGLLERVPGKGNALHHYITTGLAVKTKQQ